jgi:serine/threonine protein phosphatase PrpC
MSKYLSGNFSSKTDVGKVRMSNEDQARALTNARGNVLLLICDGMGGHLGGSYASSKTVDFINEAYNKLDTSKPLKNVGFFRKNPALLQPKFGAFSSGRDGLRRFFPQK